MQPVEGLGEPGRIVNVPPGFARNKLLPQKLALPAVPKYLKEVEAQREVRKMGDQTELRHYQFCWGLVHGNKPVNNIFIR